MTKKVRLKNKGKSVLSVGLSLFMSLGLMSGNISSVSAYSSGARHTKINDDVFLGGNYIEIGISKVGSFGTESDAPSNFHPTNSSNKRIGMVSNPTGDENDWNSVTTDYFLPVTIDESFTIGYNGERQATGSQIGTKGLQKNIDETKTETVNQSSGNHLKAVTTGYTTDNVKFVQTVEFDVNDKYFTTTVQLKNENDNETLSGVRYMRAFDPDQHWIKDGNSLTNNVVGNPALDPYGTSVFAYGLEDRVTTPFIFFSADKRATAGYTTNGLNFSDIYNKNKTMVITKNTSNYADNDIFIYFELGDLKPGKSKSFSYISSLDTNLNNAIDAIKKTLKIGVDAEAGTLTGFENNNTYTVTTPDAGKWTIEIDANGDYKVKASNGTIVTEGTGASKIGVAIIEEWIGEKLTVKKADSDPADVDISFGSESELTERAKEPAADITAEKIKGDIGNVTVNPAVIGQQYAVYAGKKLVAGWTTADSDKLVFDGVPKGDYTVKTRNPGSIVDGILPSKPTDGAKVTVPYSSVDDLRNEASGKLADIIKNYNADNYYSNELEKITEIENAAKAEIKAATTIEGIDKILTDVKNKLDGVDDKATSFVKNKLTKDGNHITSATSDTYKQILASESDWKNLTSAQQAQVNKILGTDCSQMLNNAKNIDNSATNFINGYLTIDGMKINEVTRSTVDKILASQDAYKKITDGNVKDAIDEKLGYTGGYDKLVSDAKEFASNGAAKFITDNLIKDGKPIISGDLSNADQIMKAKDNYDKLSEAEKAEVDKQLKDDGYDKGFKGLYNDAVTNVSDEATAFVKTNLTKDGETIAKVEKSTYDKVLASEVPYGKITSQEVKNKIDELLGEANPGQTYQKLLDGTKEAVDASANAFVKEFGATEVTPDNYAQILKGKETWDKMTKSEKAAVEKKLGTDFDDLLTKATDLDDKTDTFIDTFVTETKDGKDSVIKEITPDNYQTILSGKDNWDKLTDNEKTVINNKLKEKGVDVSYNDLFENADKLNKDSDQFIKDNLTDGDGELFLDANADNYEAIIDLAEKWDALSDDVKQAINDKLVANGGKTIEDLTTASKDIEEAKNGFIAEYVSDEDGNIYKEMDSTNYEQILSGLPEWDTLSKDEKAAINNELKASVGKTYDDMIAKAEEMEKARDSFVEKYVSDKDGNVYKEVNSTNYEQVLSGLAEWNKLSDDEKAAINNQLKAAGSKSYDELIAKAQDVEKTTSSFVDKYVSDKDGNIYKELNASNYEQILSGLAEWNKLSDDEKAAINNQLKAAGSKSYDELIAKAQDMQKAANSFVDKYLSDKDGNVYKEVNSSNYQQILSGKDAWSKLSQAEKDAINAILMEKMGKTYEQLLVSAVAMSNVKTEDNTFVEMYMLLGMLSLGALLVLKRRKENY